MFDVNDPKVARRYVPILKQEIDRTLNLLKDFLDFTKIKIETDIFDINLLILEVFNSLSNLLNNKRSSFVTNVSDEEFFIEGDYNRIKQVIINVVKNSFEACINDPIISLNVSKNNKYYIIEIKDNGIGMDSYTLKKIKEPFYTTKNYGTGLGVSLSKEIIESHKGSMTYNSIKNVGTTVTIKLPLSKKSFN